MKEDYCCWIRRCCTKCKESKSIILFTIKRKSKDGYTTQCKMCIAVVKKKHYQENKEKIGIARQKYIRANKDKIAVTVKKYRYNNKQYFIDYGKAYYINNKGIFKSKGKLYRKNNKEKLALLSSLWQKANPEKCCNKGAKRRSAKLQANPYHKSKSNIWEDIIYNNKALAKFYLEAQEQTIITGIPHEVDHIIPLQGEFVCGLHVHNNLQVITKEANCSKGNTFDNSLLEP